MNKELQKNLLWALLVGIVSGIEAGIYAALPLESPLIWACFIPIPVVFLFGGKWEDIPFHWLNVLIGVGLGGWLAYFLTGVLAPSMGTPAALGLATVVGVTVVQGLTFGVFTKGGPVPWLGRCPMAFIGMIATFAAGGTNYVVLVVSLLVGIVGATVMAQSGAWAAKMVGYEETAA